jgi:hypothetical protein
MGTQYPVAAPSLSGDVLAINRFLKDTPMVVRALRTIEQQMLISDKVLKGQLYTESGALLYQQNETIFADRTPKAVTPGSDYPLTGITLGTAQLANTVKWGQDAEFTDEKISRERYEVIRTGFRKLVNSSMFQIDAVALSAVSSAVTQNTAALASWAATDGSAKILRDIMRAVMKIVGLKQGYLPDTVLLGLDTFANVTSDDKLLQLLPREYPGVNNTPVTAGISSPFIKNIGGLTFLTSPTLPTTGVATVLDSSVLGSFVDEILPAPGYIRGEGMTQVKTMRDDEKDQWRVRARRITVPIVQEPGAAWKITGVDA